MPQEFYILKCFSCSTYQVHIVKKAKKWSCKMCGEKQSLIKVFGQGSAKDCREQVQKLNFRGGIAPNNLEEHKENEEHEEHEEHKEHEEHEEDGEHKEKGAILPHSKSGSHSKWACFLEDEDSC